MDDVALEFDDAALGLDDVALGLELHCFGSRCHRYSQDTHYHYFRERVLMFVTTTRLLRRLRHCPGRLLFREESGCSPRKALPGKPHRAPVPSDPGKLC